ncbi:hypothetical protein J6590_095215 [Homalodisca vitripennis]|nr:hypothetical protein J6590_095215 [Homalodisca vitripennis]
MSQKHTNWVLLCSDSMENIQTADTNNTDTDNTDTNNTDTINTDTNNTETHNTDTNNTDTDNTDTNNTDTDNTDTTNTDTNNTETHNTDTNNTETHNKVASFIGFGFRVFQHLQRSVIICPYTDSSSSIHRRHLGILLAHWTMMGGQEDLYLPSKYILTRFGFPPSVSPKFMTKLSSLNQTRQLIPRDFGSHIILHMNDIYTCIKMNS